MQHLKKAALDEARRIIDRAERERRSLTRDEKNQAERLIARANEINDDLKIVSQIDRLRGGGETEGSGLASGPSFGAAVKAAGFDLRSNPSVEFSAASVFGAKANVLPAVTSWNPLDPQIIPMGTDRRFLYPNLPTTDVEDATAVQDFKHTARTLTGSVQRNLDATTAKANVDFTLTLVTEALSQFAVTLNDIPNAVLESVPLMGQFLNDQGRFQVDNGLDKHVFSQIVAAAPPFGVTGTDLITKLRNGIASMRAEGANPTIAVLNATDAAALDLQADAGGFIFPTRDVGSSSPLYGLKIIERTSATGTEPPYLIDPNMLGRLYLGTARFEADPFTGFKRTSRPSASRSRASTTSATPRARAESRRHSYGDDKVQGSARASQLPRQALRARRGVRG